MQGNKGYSMVKNSVYGTLFKIALPIALQNLISSSINMLDTFMIGQLGEGAIAAVGIANQIFFLMALILFGINSGSGVFYSQFFGKKDLISLRKTMGLTFTLGMLVSSIFFLAAFFYPEMLISIYSREEEIITTGGKYLKIVSLSYMFTSVSFLLSSSLRSIGIIKPSLINSFISLVINGGLNYVLIFGKLGFPPLGIKGAAIATLTARIVEFFFFALGIYIKKYQVFGRFKEYMSYDKKFVKRYFRTTSSVIINEVFWSLGMTMHSIVFARMGIIAMASYNITKSLEGLVYVVFIGLSNAAVVSIGQSIGKGDHGEAMRLGKAIVKSCLVAGVISGVVIIIISKPFLSVYKISEEVKVISRGMIFVYSIMILFRGTATVSLTGILRSGGDTSYGMWADILTLWLIAVPLSIIGGIYLGLNPILVYFLAQTDIVAKFFIGIKRLYSASWINNLVSDE